MSDAQRFPLSWPVGWKRTPSHQREVARFQTSSHRDEQRRGADGNLQMVRVASKRVLTVADAIKRLSSEVDRLGATDALVSSNVQLKLDGLPRSGQPEPSDPGAAVYFRLKGKPRCLACDKWTRVADNIAAIAQHIDALRRIDRYGVGTMEQAFAGYAALPPSPSDWWIVLQVTPEATSAQIDDSFRRLAKSAHPDHGGSHHEMARLNAARDEARKVGR